MPETQIPGFSCNPETHQESKPVESRKQKEAHDPVGQTDREERIVSDRDAEVLAQACLLWPRARRGYSLGPAGRNLKLGQGRV